MILSPGQTPPTNRKLLLAGGAIVGVAFLAYANTFSVPFLFDDYSSIPDNPTIRSLVHDWWRQPEYGITVSGRPLLNFTLAVNYAISGLSVWSYHLVNILIHAASGCLLFGIVRRTLVGVGDRRLPNDLALPAKARSQGDATIPASSKDATGLALATALLWVVHPVQTEAVTYIIQRAESLVSLLYLLTLWCFIRAVEPGAGRRWPWLTVLACLLGMAAKEVMVTAPVMVLLYDRIFVAGSWRQVWSRRWRLHLGLAATWIFLGWLVLHAGDRGGTAGFGTAVTPWRYALTQVDAVVHYLRLAVWPHPLVFDYGYTTVEGPGDTWSSALVLLPLLGASLWLAARGRPVGYVAIFFFVVLAPSSSVVPIATQVMNEHRLYLALAAVVVLAVLGLHAWLGRRVWVVLGLIGSALLATTVSRNRDYQTDVGLWEDTVLKRPDNARALTTLGSLYERDDRLADAIPLLEQAIATDPQLVEAHNNLGNVWIKVNQPEKAADCFQGALAILPDQPEVLNNLGNALLAIGRGNDAIIAWEKALRLKPGLTGTRTYLTESLIKLGRYPEAEVQYRILLTENPEDASLHGNLGNVLIALDRPEEALAEFSEVVRLQPESAEMHNQLGIMLARRGRLAEALAQFEEAVRLKPDFVRARENADHARTTLRGR